MAPPATAPAPAPANPLRAVVFDFDLTLTVLPEVPRYRLFPHFDGQQPDVAWLREVAFGGEERLGLLLRALEELQGRWGLELFVLSYAPRKIVARALELVGALRHFGQPPEERLFGYEALEAYADKGRFLAGLLEQRCWRREEVLFLDDQPDNVRPARLVCQAYWVRGGRGLGLRELGALRASGGAELVGAKGEELARHKEEVEVAASDATERSRSSLPSIPSSEDGERGDGLV
mmetsp:Transcript_79651/g.247370  ORF Transcript_79651/g.247370 Transcript_79651/m.247370 type:complete len:234 (-) Transcript_79651:46-747(-)